MSEDTDIANGVCVGLNQDLEKEYLRLTGVSFILTQLNNL